jgi:redox-sensitive bicupin YhaK (pirin superfamily)
MNDPKYGVEPPENLPKIVNGQANGLLLAGSHEDHKGPFQTKQPLQMIDYTLQPNSKMVHRVPEHLDNCLLFIYAGNGKIGTTSVQHLNVIRFDATDTSSRDIEVATGASEMSFIIFAGKRINEPVAWHGPFVMNTDEDIKKTLTEYRAGKFPPKRVPWDYKKISEFPKDHAVHTGEL